MRLINVALLIIIGFIGVVTSATNQNIYFYIKREVIYILTGILFFLIFKRLDVSIYTYSLKPLIFVFFLVFILVLIYGVKLKGTKGWFKFFDFYIQPTEILKPFYIVIISHLFEKVKTKGIATHLFFILTSILIILQPDISGSIPYFFIYALIGFVYGMKMTLILSLLFFGVVSIGLSTTKAILDIRSEFSLSKLEEFIYNLVSGKLEVVGVVSGVLFVLAFLTYIMKKRVLLYSVIVPIIFGIYASIILSIFIKEYHIKRISTYVNPKIDPLGYGYNIKQSIVAIGAGGITGSGLKETSAQLGLLPSAKTDFIFAAVSERGGFFVSFIVILLYYLFLRDIYRSIFLLGITEVERCILLGFLISFGFNIIYNLLMSVGLLPVMGIPLPFLSYGGSYMVGCFISIGIIWSIISKSRG
ncbi:MAG: FtsW/RodA/SpoVE family cell cycle protein [bacterium]|nr:FtsW/RodA/SpoVE family cell cycle protein [bacterium]